VARTVPEAAWDHGAVSSLDLAHRYGAPPRWRRPAVIALSVVIGLVFAVWLAWTTFVHATPEAESSLVGWRVVDAHRATAHVDVALRDGVRASCVVRAYAADHTTVGELAFTPRDGRNDLDIRTERRATSVELIGCTTPDQPRPR
jgi:hypothetical protein